MQYWISTKVSDVPRGLHSWVSTIQTVVLTADVFELFIKCCFYSNERVWCTTQLAKLSFNHSNGRTHSWRFSTFYRYKMLFYSINHSSLTRHSCRSSPVPCLRTGYLDIHASQELYEISPATGNERWIPSLKTGRRSILFFIPAARKQFSYGVFPVFSGIPGNQECRYFVWVFLGIPQ